MARKQKATKKTKAKTEPKRKEIEYDEMIDALALGEKLRIYISNNSWSYLIGYKYKGKIYFESSTREWFREQLPSPDAYFEFFETCKIESYEEATYNDGYPK